MLIAFARKALKAKVKKLEKMKKTMQAREEIVKRAHECMEGENRGPKLKPEYVDCIMWKTKEDTKPKGKIGALKERWAECKDFPSPTESIWTPEYERRLEKAQRGDLENYQDTSQFKHAKAVKCTYIRDQSQYLDQSEKSQLLASIFMSMDNERKHEFVATANGIMAGDEPELTCFDYDSDVHVSDSESSSLHLCESSVDGDEEEHNEEQAAEINQVEERTAPQEQEITKRRYTNYCASREEFCRCPWIPVTKAHTCVQCGQSVHAFCLGQNVQGGRCKCARCVEPRGVCESAMELEPFGPPLSPVSSRSSSPLSSHSSTTSEEKSDESDGDKGELSAIQDNMQNIHVVGENEQSDEESGETNEDEFINWELMSVPELQAECKRYKIFDRRMLRKQTLINHLQKKSQKKDNK